VVNKGLEPNQASSFNDLIWLGAPIIAYVQSNNSIALVALFFALLAVTFGRFKSKQPYKALFIKLEKLASIAMYGSYIVWLLLVIRVNVTYKLFNKDKIQLAFAPSSLILTNYIIAH